MDDRTAETRCDSHSTADQFIIEKDETNSDAEAEPELSFGSRSFVHRVNNQVRKRQKQSSKDATRDSDKHSEIWRMFMSSTLTSICIHGGRITQTIGIPSKILKISQ